MPKQESITERIERARKELAHAETRLAERERNATEPGEAVRLARERLAALEAEAKRVAEGALREQLQEAEQQERDQLAAITEAVADLAKRAYLTRAARAIADNIRTRLGITISSVDVVENAVVAGLIRESVVDGRVFAAPQSVLLALDPQRQEARQAREAEQARLREEANARAEAERAKDPAVIAELQARERRHLEHVVQNYRTLPGHPKAKAARARLQELGA
jgi:hypothetical protein